QRLVVLADPFDDHRLGLLHHADALRNQHDDGDCSCGSQQRSQLHRLKLLLDHEGRTIYLDDGHESARLEHIARGAAPVFAFHLDSPRPAGRDALGHHARLARQCVDAGSEVTAGAELEVVHQARPQSGHADNAGQRQRAPLRYDPNPGKQRHDAGDNRPRRQTGEPKAGGEHLRHEESDGPKKPKQPIMHMAQSCNPYQSYAIQYVSSLRGAASMIVRSLSLVAAATLLVIPAAAQTTRHVLKGDSVAVYNLVGALRVEAGSGSDVVVDLQRGATDAAKLQVESGPLRGRETLRVIYPDDIIVMPDWGRGGGGWNTTLRVRDDGTFGA